MNKQVIVKPMDAAVVGAVAELEAICFSSPWSEQSVRNELENPWALWYVAFLEERFAGYLGVEYGPDGADIMNIAVTPEARRQGVAEKLMETVLYKLEAMQLQWLTLEVRVSNAPAIAFYQKHGFVQVGVRKNYYTKPKEDAILMTKTLGEKGGIPC